MHGVESGSRAVPHHVGQNEAIVICVELADGEVVPSDHVMGQVERGKTDPSVLRQVLFQGKGLDPLRKLQVRVSLGIVLEGLYCSDNLPVRIMKGGNRHSNGYTASSPGLGEDDEGRTAYPVGDHAAIERTETRATETAPILVLVNEEVIHASVSNHILRGPAGDPLGRFVPVEDPAISVSYI